MTKTRNGILLVGVLLATSVLAGRTMAGETGGTDALVSWGTVPTAELATQRGLGNSFDFTVVDIDIGNTIANDGSTAIGSGSIAALDGSTAIGDGAQAGDNGTAVGANNSGGVATGDGTIAVGGDVNDSFNTTEDTYLVGKANAKGTIDNSTVGDIGETGAIKNINISGMNGVSTVMNNTGALVNMQNSMVFNVYLQ